MSVYNGDSNTSDENSSLSIPFLKCLNAINGSTFKLLLGQIVSYIKSENFNRKHESLLFNLLLLMSINGNDYISNSIMLQLMLIKINPPESQELAYMDWPILLRFRQEINSFHPSTMRETIKSLAKSLLNNSIEYSLSVFVENLTLMHDWDLKSKNSMR